MTKNKIALISIAALLFFTSCAQKQIVNSSTEKKSTSGAALIRSDYKSKELIQLCKKAINDARDRINALIKIPTHEKTFENSVLAYETHSADLSDQTNPLVFMGYVSTSDDLRKEGSECEELSKQFAVETNSRKDLYIALKDQKPRNREEKRLHSEMLKVFEMNGLKLPDDQLAQVKELNQKLATIQTQFSTNLNNDATSIELTEAELAGLPEDYRAELKKTPDGSKYVVNTRRSDATVVLENASDSETRRKFLFASQNHQAKVNTPLMEAAIEIRQKIAKLMGYSTWADFRISTKMAKDGKTVLTFLNGLKSKLAKRNQSDLAKLLKLKKELDPKATEVNAWDINYIAYQLKKRDYSMDEEKIKEYLPADPVVEGVFKIYSKLFGVRFTEIKNTPVWSPDVKLYQAEDIKKKIVLGYFYTDFVPRPKKYGHAAAFGLIEGRLMKTGAAEKKYSFPVAAIVSNFNPPLNGKPSLLSHDNVETLFHEFGHIMNQILTRAPYASLSGTDVAGDFVEAPSQMLEEWVWNTSTLKDLSGHYLNRSQKLPDDLLKKMMASRDFNRGYFYTRQLLFALLDMNFHTRSGPVDVTKTFDQMHEEIIGIKPIEGGHFVAGFGHLIDGYDAGYYGYLWSEVYAADMLTRFASSGMLNSKVGGDYRRIILEKGNMKDASELLREFLGRKANSKAFFKKLKI